MFINCKNVDIMPTKYGCAYLTLGSCVTYVGSNEGRVISMAVGALDAPGAVPLIPTPTPLLLLLLLAPPLLIPPPPLLLLLLPLLPLLLLTPVMGGVVPVVLLLLLLPLLDGAIGGAVRANLSRSAVTLVISALPIMLPLERGGRRPSVRLYLQYSAVAYAADHSCNLRSSSTTTLVIRRPSRQ